MLKKLLTVSALAVGVAGGVLAGCQTYDFEPVQPLVLSSTNIAETIKARQDRPNILMLVDTSGSMKDPAGSSTRIAELKSAMGNFLSKNGSLARLGLAQFPMPVGGDACLPTSAIRIPLINSDDDAALQSHAAEINAAIQAIDPIGGTPTSLSLDFVSKNVPELKDVERGDYVLLLTDGEPNCNPQNPKTPAQCGTCGPDGVCSTDETKLCLDDVASLQRVQELRAAGVNTIVIGFGDAVNNPTSAGYKTLDAMAEAGGFARKCDASNSCGAGDTCDTATGLCTRSHYIAANASDLGAALAEIINMVKGDPCMYKISPTGMPPNTDYVVVYVNGVSVPPGSDGWQLVADGVQLTGATCTQVKNSTASKPVDVEIRVLKL